MGYTGFIVTTANRGVSSIYMTAFDGYGNRIEEGKSEGYSNENETINSLIRRFYEKLPNPREMNESEIIEPAVKEFLECGYDGTDMVSVYLFNRNSVKNIDQGLLWRLSEKYR